MDELQKCAKLKKLDTKSHILYDPIYNDCIPNKFIRTVD